jgi:hypothetical protein
MRRCLCRPGTGSVAVATFHRSAEPQDVDIVAGLEDVCCRCDSNGNLFFDISPALSPPRGFFTVPRLHTDRDQFSKATAATPGPMGFPAVAGLRALFLFCSSLRSEGYGIKQLLGSVFFDCDRASPCALGDFSSRDVLHGRYRASGRTFPAPARLKQKAPGCGWLCSLRFGPGGSTLISAQRC